VFHWSGGDNTTAFHFIECVRTLLANIAQQSWAEWGYDIVPVALAEAWMHAQDKQWAETLAAIDKADCEEAEQLACEEAECKT